MRHLPLAAALLLFPAIAPAQDAAVPTIRTNVRLTTVDVIVTDKKGVPVHGLKQDDFSVRENKQPQAIRNFDEHTGAATTVYDPPRPGVFTNATAARGGVSNVVLVDFLNTPPEEQAYMRDQLVKFVIAQPPGTRTAIFTMSSSVRLLQDFTADPELLKLALKRMGTKFSPYTGQISPGPDNQMQALENLYESTTGAQQQQMAQLMQALGDYKSREQAFFTRNKVLLTMSCLRDVARYLSGVNGRKNLMWLSTAFPVFIQQDSESTNKPFQVNEVMDVEMRNTQAALTSSQVAIYPVDPRGVPVPPSYLLSNTDSTGNLSAQQRMYGSSSLSPQNKASDNDILQEHSSMEQLADATGGKAFFNTNDLAGSLHEAQADGSQFYTLTYVPPPAAKPGQFRNIEVAVKGKGLHVRYRKGYYAPGASKNGLTDLNTKNTAFNMQAMAPQSSEVLFQLEVSSPAVVDQTKVIGGPVFDALPHNTYQLNALVDFSTLQFSPGDDGKMHGVVDIATVIYDKNGKVLDSRSDRATLALDEARYQAMVKGGMKYHQLVSIPDKGDGYVRVAVHDAVTDKLGTVQMAMASIRESEKAR